MNHLSSVSLLMVLGMLGSACSEPTSGAPTSAGTVSVGAVDSAWPAVAVPAFLSRSPCLPPYTAFREGCVHAAYSARTSTADLATQFDAYQRGAAPPRVGGPIQQAAATGRANAHTPRLDPGALAKGSGTGAQDAELARQRRLRALEEMLIMVNEKLARDRKRRTGPARTQDGTDEANAGGASANPRGTYTAGASSAAGDESVAQLVGALKQMEQGQAATMLQQMEAKGLRQELGEEVWSQLSTEARGTAAGR
ncbi:MAG: hypothetical protein QM778_28865 [Myxococcales bacterium]